VIGTRRSVTEPTRDAHGHQLYPLSDLHRLLGESDFVVLAMPLTKDTHHMIGEPELRAMKRSAYLINVARGSVVDESVLVRALQEKWIAGAGLDVTEVEPLPPESPLWDLDNVIISPHHSGMTKEAARRGVDLFCENLRRYLSGRPLLNLVDVERGY
jgi:phosphoglycerate dehydrogenase-like enzyme